MRLSFSIVSAFMISHFQFFIFNFQLFAPSCLRVFVRDISSIPSFPVFNFPLGPFSRFSLPQSGLFLLLVILSIEMVRIYSNEAVK